MEKLIELAKVFSDQNRLNIIRLLLRDKRLCVCEISDTLKLSQPLVSRHLKQMKQAGVLVANKEKKWVHYSLTCSPHPLLQSLLSELETLLDGMPTIIVCSRESL